MQTITIKDGMSTTFDVLIEIPKGSRNKYEFDKERGMVRFDRMLFSSVQYPCDYGFILDTLAEDSDALDVLVMVWEPTFPGCLMEVRPIGIFLMSDDKGPDQKVLCVPVNDPLWSHLDSLDDVPPHLLKEIEHFFLVYKDLEAKKTNIQGWAGKDKALEIIEECRVRFNK